MLTTPIWRIHSTSHVRGSTVPFLPKLAHLLAQMNSAPSWQNSRLNARTLVIRGEWPTFTGKVNGEPPTDPVCPLDINDELSKSNLLQRDCKHSHIQKLKTWKKNVESPCRTRFWPRFHHHLGVNILQHWEESPMVLGWCGTKRIGGDSATGDAISRIPVDCCV